MSILKRILFLIVIVAFYIFAYFNTKHIDFALYVRAWMIGFRVHNQFDTISNLITRSCFYKIELESSGDKTEETYFENLTEYGTRSNPEST